MKHWKIAILIVVCVLSLSLVSLLAIGKRGNEDDKVLAGEFLQSHAYKEMRKYCTKTIGDSKKCREILMHHMYSYTEPDSGRTIGSVFIFSNTFSMTDDTVGFRVELSIRDGELIRVGEIDATDLDL